MTTTVTRKVEGTEFVHRDDFKGEVKIRRGGESVTVPVNALRVFVAETVRAQTIDRVQALKPIEIPDRLV